MADFKINVTGDAQGALNAARSVDGAFGKLRSKAETAGQGMATSLGVPVAKLQGVGVTAGLVGAGLSAALTAPLLGFATSAVQVAVDFEQSMNRVQAVTTVAGASFADLEATASSLGRTTQFTATEAADAMVFLGQAGFTTDQVLGSIEGTLNLAAAGSLGLAEAADITSNVLAGFGLASADAATQSENMARVVDVMAFAAANSNTNIQQLGQALSFVAPIANQLGIEIEDTAAFIGKLSDAGIQSTRAGTGLRQALASLVNVSATSQTALDGLGVSITDNDGKFIGLEATLGKMTAAGAQASDFFQVFGTRGAAVAAVLADQVGPSLDGFNEGLDNAEGSAKDMAETINMGLPGALTKMNSAIDGAKNTLGQALAPAIETVAGLITTLSSAFANLPSGVVTVIAILGGLVAAIGPIIALVGTFTLGLGALAAPLGAAGGALTLIGGIFTALTGPIGLTVAAIVGLGALLFTFRTEITEAGAGLFAFAAEFIAGIPGIDRFKSIFNATMQIIGLSIELVILPFKAAFEALGEGVGFVFDIFRTKGKEAMEANAAATALAEKEVEKLNDTTVELSAETKDIVKEIENLEKAHEAASKGAGKHGKETKKAKKALKEFKFEAVDAIAEIQREERELKKLNKVLRDLARKDMKDAIEATKDMKEATDTAAGRFAPFSTSGTTAMSAVFNAINPVNDALGNLPTKTQASIDAFGRLQTQGIAELTTLRDQATADLDLIKASGIATPTQITEAWRNQLQAQADLLAASGIALGVEEQTTLDALNAQLEAGLGESGMLGKWTDFGESVGTTISDVAGDLFAGMLEGDFSLASVGSALTSIKDEFAAKLFDPVKEQINSFVTDGIDFLIGKLTGGDGLSGAISGIFGGGGGGGGGGGVTGTLSGGAGVPSIPGLGGGGGGGGALGGAASAAGGLNPLTAVTGLGTLASSIFGNFQNARQETTLNAIEESTRRATLFLGDRGDGGILQVLFRVLDTLEFGTFVKVLENIRDTSQWGLMILKFDDLINQVSFGFNTKANEASRNILTEISASIAALSQSTDQLASTVENAAPTEVTTNPRPQRGRGAPMPGEEEPGGPGVSAQRGRGSGPVTVTFTPTVTVNAPQGINAQAIADAVADQVGEQGDRFIRNTLVPAMDNAFTNNTGGVTTNIARSINRRR